MKKITFFGGTERDFEIRQVSFYVKDLAEFICGLKELSARNEVHIVCFNARMVAGSEHVYSALMHARRAVVEGSCISGSFEIEALLYASGSRQCNDAVKFGVHEGENMSFVCVYPNNDVVWTGLSKDMRSEPRIWDSIDEEKKGRLIELFGITKDELFVAGESRLKDLILERVALLEVYK